MLKAAYPMLTVLNHYKNPDPPFQSFPNRERCDTIWDISYIPDRIREICKGVTPIYPMHGGQV